MEKINRMIREWIEKSDEKLKEISPTKLLIGTIATAYVVHKTTRFLEENDLKQWVKGTLISMLKAAPGIGGAIEAEKKKLIKKVVKGYKGIDFDKPEYELPKKGYDAKTIVERVTKMVEAEAENVDGEHTAVSGTIYIGGKKAKEHTKLQSKIYDLTALSNPLHPESFPSQRKFEAEVVRMTINMMNGDSKAVGCITTGGTESIIMAMKAYRDQAAEKAPWIKVPEICAPVTAHAAFYKAAHYFKMKLVLVPVNEETQEVEAETMKKYITANTVVIVGSAPCYSAGVVDPIPELGKLAQQKNIGLHVDCCLGGFIVPFAKRLDPDRVPTFDFRVKGVTSMSADTHKYGMAVKGSSVVMYRSEELRHKMYFLCSEFPGGFYASPTMPGSRAGGLVAACWASLLHIGDDGYMENAKKMLESADYIREAIKANPHVEILGRNSLMLIAMKSADKRLNIYHVVDAMSKRGFKINPLQRPAGAHFCMTPKTMEREQAKRFVAALNESINECVKSPNTYKDGTAPVYGAAIAIPVKEIEYVTERILDSWTNVNFANNNFDELDQ